MKRPLAMFERALYLDRGFHVNVMVTARIRGRIAEPSIKQALARVQTKHPVLRCLIVQELSRPCFVLQDQPTPIPLRIVERQNDNDWFEVSMEESLQRFDGSRQPLARLIWLRGGVESELLLVCSHAICDGRSLMTLLREILLLCDQPDADIGTPTSLNAIEEIFPARVLADRGLQRRIRWRAAMMKLMLRFARSGPGRTYGKIYRSLWTLDDQASTSLVVRCKAEGVNVFAALGVAFMQAFRDVCGAKQIVKFEAPVDIRRYLPDLRIDSLFAVAPTITLSLRKLRDIDPVTSDFWTLARSLKTDMDNKIDRLESTVYNTFLGMEHLHDVYDRMVVYAQSKGAGRQVSLSYVGKLELGQNYRDFRLQEICDISAMMSPTPANLIAIYSFAGQFHFSLSSDESSLPYVQALQIKKRVMDTLIACVTEREIPVAILASASSAARAGA
jgi:NRPS condensation-like uncharacterized protein